jgi:uncharacterized protein YvpB
MRLSRRALMAGALGLALVGCAASEETPARPPTRSAAAGPSGPSRPPATPADPLAPLIAPTERAAAQAAGAPPPSWLRGQVVLPPPGQPAEPRPVAGAGPATTGAGPATTGAGPVTTGAGPATTSPARPPDLRRLAVPYRSQLDGNPYQDADCGPTSMAMVLEYYGRRVPTRDLRAIVNQLQGTAGVFDAGSTIESLAEVAQRNGLRPLDLAADGKLRRWSLDDVRRQLDAGRPIVPQLWYRGLPDRANRPYDGDHYVVLTGYGPDEVVYNDPIDKDGPGANRRMSWAQLDRAWRNSDFPYAAFAIAEPASR